MRALIVVLGCAACTQPYYPSRHPTTSGELLVTTQQTCPVQLEHCDILEIVDIHTDATSQEKGFAELRQRARARGADAVIGAEFEHGTDAEPSHLAGLLVRRGQGIPPHTVVGDIVVESDADDRHKGLDALHARAAAMGGDEVINVTFEHGEDGGRGRLQGRVIRHRD